MFLNYRYVHPKEQNCLMMMYLKINRYDNWILSQQSVTFVGLFPCIKGSLLCCVHKLWKYFPKYWLHFCVDSIRLYSSFLLIVAMRNGWKCIQQKQPSLHAWPHVSFACFLILCLAITHNSEYWKYEQINKFIKSRNLLLNILCRYMPKMV